MKSRSSFLSRLTANLGDLYLFIGAVIVMVSQKRKRDLFADRRHKAGSGFYACPGNVGSDEKAPAVFDGQERRVFLHGFLTEYIKPGSSDFVFDKCICQILF